MIPRTILVGVLLCAGLAPPVRAEDVVLVGGTIFDGSGKAGIAGNVRIRGGKIDEIGTFRTSPNDAIIDVKGLIVAPGFIDINNHSAGLIDSNLGAPSQIMQGITTVVLGLDGEGPIQVEAAMVRFDEKTPALNIATFAGHNTARRDVLGQDYKRPATADEIRRMGVLVEQAMRQGAFGLSSNLESGPGTYSTLDEIVELAKVVARYAGVYVCHVRNEGETAVEGVREAIEVGRRAKVPVHISHLKLGSAAMWGRASAVLAELDSARAQGVDVTADVFPYNSFDSDLTAILPGGESTAAPDTVAKALQDVGGPGDVLIIRSLRHLEYAFKTLAQIATEKSMNPIEVYLQIARDGGARVITSSMSEKDVRALLLHSSVMIGSDGGIGYLHPKGAGAFPRVLGLLVRDEKLMTLENAIRKMTAFPASRLGLKERGVLQKGASADVVVFDPARIQDRASPQNPATLSEGMKYVFVNGSLVVKDGQLTPERPGIALR